jgi:Cof subfamily protein (haloacid dehalogenase superfamily)
MIKATGQKVKDIFAIIPSMHPIKAIILDVDGVIVGEKIGFNSPNPHPKVINKLKKIREAGIPVYLCTAKPHYSVEKIISDAGLRNLHITQGGGVLINPLDGFVYKKSLIVPKMTHDLARAYINNNTYIEFYTLDNYFIQANQKSHLTQIHSHILQKKPVIVANLPEEAFKQEIVKLMPIAKNEEDKKNITQIFEPFKDSLTLSWGIHPIALPHQFGIITAPGISKKLAVDELSKHENVKPSEILAVGDSASDWQFIEPCGYGATTGNADKELKALAQSKGAAHSYIGKSVDENGILDIFKYFQI